MRKAVVGGAFPGVVDLSSSPFLASRSLSVQRALGCSRVQLEVALGPRVAWVGGGILFLI